MVDFKLGLFFMLYFVIIIVNYGKKYIKKIK